jgi:hypothetical protein
MNSTDLPNVMFLNDDQRQDAIDRIDTMQNLLYLIGADAFDPTQVRAHAKQAERLLSEMQTQMLPD